ncbi:MAG: Cell division protein FtsA [Candidatus Omnitrophica bacterium]|nr:Cell division protein FtsA [Candidatus Omnitrophota bacterium]
MKSAVLRAPTHVRWVVDIGPERVAAVAGQREASGRIRVLGAGEAPRRGFAAGEVTHTGDAVESVCEALRRAESTAGLKATDVLYNCSAGPLTSSWRHASRLLSGEGQVKAPDVRSTRETAERLESRFERRILYAKELYFIVDDRDTMAQPLGVFGRKLEAVVHLVSVGAESLEAYQKVFRRAGFVGARPVLSLQSSAAAIADNEDPIQRRLLVDASAESVGVCVQRAGVLWRCAMTRSPEPDAVAAVLGELEKDCECDREVLLTGQFAEDETYRSALQSACGRPVRVVSPVDVPGLERARYASLAGLFKVQVPSRRPALLKVRRGSIAELRERAAAFFNEYF